MAVSRDKTVLLVEDEALIAMMEKSVLQQAGYTVRHVYTGEDAVAAAGGADPIDIVLMDIDLGPGMSGTDAAQAILSARELPLVFLSSHTEPDVVERTEGITSYGYIVKNSGTTVLLAAMRLAFRLFEEKQAVRRHEQLLTGVFNSIQDGISVLDNQLTIRHVNHAMERWYPEPDGLVGRKCHEVYHRADKICSFCPSVKALQSGSVERAIVPGRGDSSARWLEVYSYPLINSGDSSSDGVVEFVRDVTDLKIYQEELEKKTAALELLLQAGRTLSNVPDTETILQTLAETAVPLTETDTAAIYLLDGEEIYLAATTPALPPGFPANLRQSPLKEHPHIDRAIRDQEPVIVSDFSAANLTEAERQVVESRRLRTVVFVPLVGRERVLGVIIVATQDHPRPVDKKMIAHCGTVATQAALALENARLTAALRTSEGKLANAAVMARIGHWEHDLEQQIFTFSDSFYRMFRTTAADQGGYRMPMTEYARRFVHPDDIHMVAEEARKVMEATDPNYAVTLEHRVIFGDGSPGFIEVRFAVLRDEQGRAIGTYGVNQDITERKNVEEAIRATLKEREILLTEVHHRIKNSFSSVSALLKLQAENASSGEAVDALGEAVQRVESMRYVYDTLLSAGDYNEASIGQYLERLLASLRDTLPAPVAHAITADVENHTLKTKALTPLGMIVNELLTNAAKHAFPPGSSGEILVSLRREGNVLRLTVEDNGTGLPGDFVQENAGGLGMMLVRLLAEQLEGQFRIGPARHERSDGAGTPAAGTRAVVEIPDHWIATSATSTSDA